MSKYFAMTGLRDVGDKSQAFADMRIIYYDEKEKRHELMGAELFRKLLLDGLDVNIQVEGSTLKPFKGFAPDETVINAGMSKNPDAEVWYSAKNKAFVFKDGGTYYKTHETLSKEYNDAQTGKAREDVAFLNAGKMYGFDAVKGLVNITVELSDIIDDSTTKAPSCHAVNSMKTDLQSQINSIVAKNATISLGSSKSVVYAGTQTTDVTISLSVNGIEKESEKDVNVKITKNGAAIASATGAFNTSKVEKINTTTTYKSDVSFHGTKLTEKSVTVYAEYPAYIGGGKTYMDVVNNPAAKLSPRTSIASSVANPYKVTTADGDKIFIICPATMKKIKSALYNGFGFPLKDAVQQTINDVSYNVYESTATYGVASSEIVVTI